MWFRKWSRHVLAAVAVVAGMAVVGGAGGEPPPATAQGGEGTVLTLLHNSDGESALLPRTVTLPGGDTVPVGGAGAYAAVIAAQTADARGAGHSVINVYAGDAFLPSATLICGQDPSNPIFDALAQQAIGYDVHVFGNHEFDSGPGFLEQFIRAFEGTQPFLSANLNFSGEPGFADLVHPTGLIDGDVETPVGRSAIVRDAVTGEAFGVVGATTPTLAQVSSPRNVGVTPDLASTAAAIQAEVDRLVDEGINRIILVSHVQALEMDRQLIGMLRGVDIVIGGGGVELLLNPGVPADDQLLPGETATPAGSYPAEATDADGRTVYIATTPPSYRYAGRLDAVFDADGNVVEIRSESSFLRRVIPASPEATALGIADAAVPDPTVVATVDEPLTACLEGLAHDVVAETGVVFDVSLTGVRNGENNLGNLLADAFVAAYDAHANALGLAPRGAQSPVVVLQNGGSLRQTAGPVLPRDGEVPGVITRRDTLDVLPFVSFVTAIEGVTAADLKAALERSVSGLPGEPGEFAHVAGLRVVFNLAEPAGSRVVSAHLADGRAIVEDSQVVPGAPAVTVVTNNFMAGGGDGYEMFAGYGAKTQFPLTYEQALVEYLDALGGVIGADDPRYQPGGEGRMTFVQEQPEPTPTPTESPPAPTPTPTTPAETPTATATATVAPTEASGPPSTGSGSGFGPGSSSAAWLTAVAVLLFGAAGGAALLPWRRAAR